MATIAVHELRKHTSEVLRRVASGDRITITQQGVPVAEIRPVGSPRVRSLRRPELVEILATVQSDAELRDDLDALGDSADGGAVATS